MPNHPFIIQSYPFQNHLTILIVCDHSSNRIDNHSLEEKIYFPPEFLSKHIAYDIGAFETSQMIAKNLGATLIASQFSRLIIDPNRGEDDPTLIMQLYDGDILEANCTLTEAQRQARIEKLYRPYHDAIANWIEAQSTPPIIISLHSFTPQLQGRPPRPWEIGVLSNEDRRLADPLIAAFQKRLSSPIGDNQPYHGALKGDTMDKHACTHGLKHILLEVRNDLISHSTGQATWAELITDAIKDTLENG